MEEQTSWRAIPFNDGYKIIYNDEFIEISIVIVNPKDIEKTQQKILKGLDAMNDLSAKANKYQSISLPSLLHKDDSG